MGTIQRAICALPWRGAQSKADELDSDPAEPSPAIKKDPRLGGWTQSGGGISVGRAVYLYSFRG